MSSDIPKWSEADSQTFIDYGRYFVPHRQTQMEIICELLPLPAEPCHVVELCCGEGLLSAAILKRYPQTAVHAYDGSNGMLAAAQARMKAVGARFDTHPFDLAARQWRQLPWQPHAIVSSLAIHHLDGEQKQQLYRDLFTQLVPGGALIIADLIEPMGPHALKVAAQTWDDATRQQVLVLDGDVDGFAIFEREQWNLYRYPDPDVDKPSPLFDQLQWLQQAGFKDVDVYWLVAGHAIFGGYK